MSVLWLSTVVVWQFSDYALFICRIKVASVVASKLMQTSGSYPSSKVKTKVALPLSELTGLEVSCYFDRKPHKGFLAKTLENSYLPVSENGCGIPARRLRRVPNSLEDLYPILVVLEMSLSLCRIAHVVNLTVKYAKVGQKMYLHHY